MIRKFFMSFEKPRSGIIWNRTMLIQSVDRDQWDSLRFCLCLHCTSNIWLPLYKGERGWDKTVDHERSTITLPPHQHTIDIADGHSWVGMDLWIWGRMHCICISSWSILDFSKKNQPLLNNTRVHLAMVQWNRSLSVDRKTHSLVWLRILVNFAIIY